VLSVYGNPLKNSLDNAKETIENVYDDYQTERQERETKVWIKEHV